MFIDLQNISDIKKWVFTELTGGESNDDDDIYFELPLNDKELTNIVDMTTRQFMEWAYNGISEGWYVQQTIPGVSEYSVPKNIYALPYEIMADDGRQGSVTVSYTDFVANPIFYMGGNTIYGNSLMDTISSYYTQQNINIQNMRYLFRPMGQYRFYKAYNKLTLLNPPKSVGYKIFKCFYSENLDTNATGVNLGNIYNESIMRNLLLARCKKKVGWNLKVVPQNLINNYTIDGNAIYTEGKEDEEKYMTELKGRGNLSLFIMG